MPKDKEWLDHLDPKDISHTKKDTPKKCLTCLIRSHYYCYICDMKLCIECFGLEHSGNGTWDFISNVCFDRKNHRWDSCKVCVNDI